MKNILIIYPQWPPSNQAGVHRPRLLGNFLNGLGWHPIVLTVNAEYYEEKLDLDFARTVSDEIEVHYVKAFKPAGRVRIIGDITLRAFFFLLKGAGNIIKTRKIDFIYIPIPNYYTAVLGRILHAKYKIPYGIDYIDPWSNGFPGQERKFSRAWLSNRLAHILEPYSLKRASLITGVSSSYYKYVFDKKWVRQSVLNVGMPYGFDPADHKIRLENLKFPWSDMEGCKPLIYAGAFLPKSHVFIRVLFATIANLRSNGKWDSALRLFFIGTGAYAGKSITEYAQELNIDDIVCEDRTRYPFLHVLNFLANAYGILVIGSTEKHYTASKTFQAVLSERPIFAMFHRESSAASIMEEIHADQYLVRYFDEQSVSELETITEMKLSEFIEIQKGWFPDYSKLDKYSARNSALHLVEKLNLIVEK